MDDWVISGYDLSLASLCVGLENKLHTNFKFVNPTKFFPVISLQKGYPVDVAKLNYKRESFLGNQCGLKISVLHRENSMHS